MMSQWKKGLKLLKYGYNFKSNVGCAVFFLVLGIVMMCVGGRDSFGISAGALYVVLGPMILCQMLNVMIVAKMIAACPKRRYLEIQMQDMLNFLSGTLGYVFVLVVTKILSYLRPSVTIQWGSTCLYVGISIAVVVIYVGIAFKMFWIGIIAFSLALDFIWSDGMGFLDISFVSFPAGLLLGLLMVWIAVALGGLLRRGLYKKPLNKVSLGAVSRKLV